MAAPRLSAIWAQTTAGVMGRDGGMPWHLPEDLAHFKATTQGRPVIMGRRTWESFPARFRPLPGRTNVVVTSRPQDPQLQVEDRDDGTAVIAVPSWGDAVRAAAAAPGGEHLWVIGGARLYEEALSDPEARVDHAVVSVIELDDSYLEIGTERVRRAIDLYARCAESGQWPGYSAETVTVQPPRWALSPAGERPITPVPLDEFEAAIGWAS